MRHGSSLLRASVLPLLLLCVAGLPHPATFASGGHPPHREALHDRWRARIEAIRATGQLPIIDTQATYGEGINLAYIMQAMDELGVALIAFAPQVSDAADGSRASLELHRRHPDYFIPTIADGTTDPWVKQEGGFIEQIETEARSGDYLFMGEFELRHYLSPLQFERGHTWREVAISPEAPWVHRLLALSAETQLPVQIHHEPEDGLLAPLERMLAQYPQATVIWTHLGQIRYPEKQTRYAPAYVAELLARYPNLHFDLAASAPGKLYPASGFSQNTLQDPVTGRLQPAWKDVIEAHPDRFTIGSDTSPAKADRFSDKIRRARERLADLSAPTAEQVAYQNAWYLLTRTPWKHE